MSYGTHGTIDMERYRQVMLIPHQNNIRKKHYLVSWNFNKTCPFQEEQPKRGSTNRSILFQKPHIFMSQVDSCTPSNTVNLSFNKSRKIQNNTLFVFRFVTNSIIEVRSITKFFFLTAKEQLIAKAPSYIVSFCRHHFNVCSPTQSLSLLHKAKLLPNLSVEEQK